MERSFIRFALGLTGSLLCAFVSMAQDGVDLAMQGRCDDAMPRLDKTMLDAAVPDSQKRPTATAGVRCAMLLNQQTDAMSFLAWLQQHFPDDPEVLFLAVHVFSELSDRNAQRLMHSAPDSPFVIQLNAENFEKHGEIPKAIAEYRILLQRNPDLPGIHYRIGGLLMLHPAGSLNDAEKEFEAELKLNPRNASAEFYLGELESQQNHIEQAIERYKRAVSIYPAFSDALARLGRALLDNGSTAEAIGPLEKCVELTPENPAFHLALATAYQRSGRKSDAVREFALQKSTSEAINQNTKALRKTVSGVP